MPESLWLVVLHIVPQSPTDSILKLPSDVYLVNVTLLWIIFSLSVKTAEVRERHNDAETLGQRFQEISVTGVLVLLREIRLFYRIKILLVHDYLCTDI